MKRHGFTLIEMLVAIVVLGILATMAFFGARQLRVKLNDTACLRNLHEISLALRQYQNDHNGRYPRNAFVDLYPKYLATRRVFHCPLDNQALHSSEWELTAVAKWDQTTFTPPQDGKPHFMFQSYSPWFQFTKRNNFKPPPHLVAFWGPDWDDVFKERGGQTPLMTCVHHHPRGMPVLRVDGTVEKMKRERRWQDL